MVRRGRQGGRGEVVSVATACPGVLRWPVGVDRLHLNASDALVDVACIAAGLHVFAVVDDVHAAGDLTLHDFSNRAGQALVESYSLAFTRGEQPVQVIRSRQVAGVRDEDSVDTAPHGFSFRSTSEAPCSAALRFSFLLADPVLAQRLREGK
jgi:hypothetical protein